MGSMRLAERKLFTTLHGKLEPSPATALHSRFPLMCQRLQDEALYQDSPRRWKIHEIQDNLSLHNYHVRNLPHIPNILGELIKFSSFFSPILSLIQDLKTFLIAWKYRMLDFKNLSTGEMCCVGNILNNSVYVWKRNTDSSQRGRMFKSILKKQPAFKPKDRMKWAQQYKADKQI